MMMMGSRQGSGSRSGNPVGALSVQLAQKSIQAANGLLVEIENDINDSKKIIRARNVHYEDMNKLLRLLTEENEQMKVLHRHPLYWSLFTGGIFRISYSSVKVTSQKCWWKKNR
jgi:hypothetical protein